jgi:GTP-binding protein
VGEAVFSTEQSPESLVKRLRALADKRQKDAAKERRSVAQGLMGAAHGYRALADALERQPTLPWIKSSPSYGGLTQAPSSRNQMRDAETGEVLFEITAHNQEKFLVKGGRGGLGNTNFKTSTNQTPRFAQPGEPRIEGWRILELKILADVGLVGFPNAGKSTLLSVVSAAKPEIADYPFTTLVPNLGIVKYKDSRSFVMADIPGIIEGAHEGKGLGLRFLRHIERNSLLLFMIPVDAKNIAQEYDILNNELELFNPELLDKKRVLAITKCDMLDEEMLKEIEHDLPKLPYVFISSITGSGIDKLKDLLWKELNS